MAWTASEIMMALIEDALENTAALDLNSDTFKAALFDNTITPDQTVASASSAYGAGVWAGGGVTDTGSSAPAGWPSVGRDLASVTSTRATNVYTFDAADTVSANAVTTLTNAYGVQVYDDTITTPVADQGVCYNYFGGPNTVTLGTFTIVWNALGIFTLTL